MPARCAPAFLYAEFGVERLDDPANAVIGKRIDDGTAGAFEINQAVFPQPGELFRDSGLRDTKHLLQLADARTGFGEAAQNHKPGRMGQRLQELGRAFGVFQHLTGNGQIFEFFRFGDSYGQRLLLPVRMLCRRNLIMAPMERKTGNGVDNFACHKIIQCSVTAV